MTTITVRDAELLDIMELAPRLRAADMKELKHLGSSPEKALHESFMLSDFVKTVLVDGEIVAMLGVAPLNQSDVVGVPWMLGADGLSKARRSFPIYTKKILALMHRRFPILCNYVHCENEESIRWLKHIGFTFSNTITVPSGALFFEFVRFNHV